MNARASLSLWLLCASAWAQQDIKVPAPPPPVVDPDIKTGVGQPVLKYDDGLGAGAAAPAARAENPTAKQIPTIHGKPVTPRMPAPDRVLVDQPGDGRIWASSPRYKASFDVAGATYIPFFGALAPRNYPVQFTLRSITLGDEPLGHAATPAITADDHRVRIDRGAVVEIYELGLDGIEQTFQVSALPKAGDLVVQIDVATDLAVVRDGSALRFANDLGYVSYSQAFVRDAGAAQLAIETRCDDGRIELRVPASFLAGAKLPVTIDPVVSTFTSQAATTVDIDPDVAFDAGADRYLVVWEEAFSATDHDIASILHDGSGNVIAGSFAYLDRSTSYWAHPKVACLAGHDRFLMVAENGVSPNRQIWGRARDASGATGSQFEISVNGGSGDKLHPDVGGDANLALPVYWTVVWERTYTTSDSDIHAQQVNQDSTLHGGLLLIDNSGATIDTHPGISKSDGRAPASTQDWTIVFQHTYSATDEDIRYAQVHWDGTITTASNPLNSSTRNDTLPTVSSPTDDDSGARFVLACYQGDMAAGDHDIIGSLLHGANNLRNVNLTAVENAFPTRDQITPHVDSDGCRFAVAYAELFSGNDWDILAATYHVSFGSTIGLTEGHVGFGRLVRPELHPRITSNRSGDGSIVRYAGVWDDEYSPSPLDIDIKGVLYDGETSGGGFNVLSTGCGGVGIGTSGRPAIGGAPTFTLTGFGANASVIMVGAPFGPAPVCGGACSLAVNPSLAVFVPGPSLTLPIPCDGQYVGAALAVQGITVGSGICSGLVDLSDTANMTVR